MRRTQPLYDGLWRCLCPAFDEHISRRALNASRLARPTASPLSHTRFNPSIGSNQHRRHGTDARQAESGPPSVHSLDSFFARLEGTKSSKSKQKTDQHGLLGSTLPPLDDIPSEEIVKALRALRGGNSKVRDVHSRIIHLVQFLVKHRGRSPEPFLYECMMDAMVDTQGSASGVRNLLRDMDSQGIAPTADVCQSALQALTVHPDYVIRQDVIDIMQKYWYPIDKAADQNIAIGLLRDGQHELALARLTEMHENKVRIDLWVYDIFVVEFGRVGFLDEMLQLLRQRKHAKGTDNAFRTLLLHALEVFSKSYHAAGTKFVWEYVVSQAVLNPHTTILENVLSTAAKHADTTLATEALNILSSRGRVSNHQHETLMEAFVACEDLAGAFGVMSIMERNHALIDRDMTRSIYLALTRSPWVIEEAVAAIEEMRKGQEVPLEAVLVTIEAMAKIRGSEAAMPLYSETFAITGKRPGLGVVKELILNSTSLETTVALTRDYGAITNSDARIHWDDVPMYSRMISACAEAGEFDRAFEIAERVMKSDDLYKGDSKWHGHAWVVPLIEHAVAGKDSRVWPLVDEVVQGGEKQAGRVESILQRHRLDWRLEELKARMNEPRSE